MKKLFLTSLLGFCCLAPATYAANPQQEIDGILYSFDTTNKTATVESKAYNLMTFYVGDVVVPSTVTYGGAPYTVTTIGQYAFSDYDEELTSVTLPETLTTITSYAFDGTYLTDLVIPNSVTQIGANAFEYSKLQKITLGSGIADIAANAFLRCDNMTEVKVLAETPFSIAATTFPDAVKSKVTLKVPSGKLAAYQSAANWSGFKAYEEFTSGGGDTPDPTAPIEVNYNGIWYELNPATQEATVMTVYKLVDSGKLSAYYTGDVIIPDTVPYDGKNYTVTTLGDECFWQCTMTSLTLPATLKKLGWESFYNIKTLTTLEIPDLVEVIEHGDFYASFLTSITLGSGVKTIEYDAFTNANLITQMTVKAEVPPTLVATSIPDNLKAKTTLYVPKGKVETYKTAPYWNGFMAYKEIKAPIVNPVKIGDVYYTLTESPYNGDETVFRCSVAAPVASGFANGDEYQGNITVPESIIYDDQRYVVMAVDWYAFRDQTLLTGVTLPNTIQRIGNSAFQNTSLTAITLPESVTTLENYVFRNSSKLVELTVQNPVPATVSSSTFDTNLTTRCKLYVPKGTENVYKNADYWKNFSTIEPDPDSPVRPETITLSRSNYTGLTGSTVTLTATIMPEDATDKSVEWKSLSPDVADVDADGVVTLKSAGRANIEAISNADRTLSAMCSVMVIDSEAEIDGIKYRFVLDIDNKIADAFVVRKSPEYAGAVEIPASLQHGVTFNVAGIDQNAFALMKNVTSVSIPASVKSVGRDAFRECTALERVNITNLGAWAQIDFANKLSNPVQYSGNLYLNGNAVTSVRVDASVETIKPYVFQGLAGLTSLTLDAGVKNIGAYAFEKCTSLSSVVLPETIEEIGMSAFSGCSGLISINLPSSLKNVETGILSGTAITEITVPEGVTYINNQAFQNCAELKSVTLPSTLELIYMMVWDGCENLEKITSTATLPPSFFKAEGFGDYALAFPTSIFPTCKIYVPEESVSAYNDAAGWKNFNLISAIGSDDPGVKVDIEGISYELFDRNSTAAVVYNENYSGEITVPAKVKYGDAEYNVTTVAAGAFDGLKDVTAINLPESVTTIGARAFAATSVDVFSVPQGVTEIPAEMLADCVQLVSVSLPDHLLSIGVKAFYGATSIRYIFCNNHGTGDDHVLPVFETYEGDPTNYGEAFSTEIWPDCMLVIPASMFGNYKKVAGWKNFRTWGYWHDYDILAEKVIMTPSEIKGGENETFTTTPSVEPANATVFNYIVKGIDPEIANITVANDADGKAVYTIELLKEGETSITVYCGLVKTTCTILCDNSLGVNGINADEDVRWFDLNGFELKDPVKGQPMIRVKNGKSDKVIIF